MPTLDIRTLSFLAMFSSLLLAGGLLLARRQIPQDSSLQLWSRGATAIGAAYVLYGLRALLPDLLTIVLANTLLTVGAVWLYLGNRDFRHRPPQFPWYWLMTGAAAAGFAYFTYAAPDLRARIVLVNLVTSVTCLASGVVMLPGREPRDRMVYWYVAGAYLLAALFFGARLVTTLQGVALGQDFMQLTDPMQTYAMVVGICLNSVLGVGLPILVSGRVQAQLAHSESRFRGAFEAAAHGMALVSIEGRFIRVNASLCAMLEYAEAELLATDFQTITHPDDLQADLSSLQALLNAQIPSYQMEKRYVAKSGRLIWILLSVSLVRDQAGQPLHFVSQIQDVTGKKRATERLERLLAEQRALLDNDLTGIVKVHNRRIMWANPAFEKMMGYEPGESTGVETRRHYVSDADYHAFGQQAYSVLAAGKVFRAELAHVRRDGARVWLEVSGAVLDQANDISLWGFLDVTQRRQQARLIALSEQRMDMALAGADLGLWDMDLATLQGEYNARAFQMVGLDPSDESHRRLVNRFEPLIHPEDVSPFRRAITACLQGAQPNLNIEIRLKHAEGYWIWANIRGKVVERDATGRALRMVGTNLDISERRAHEATIYELAFFDPLTNLPNRRLMMDRLAQALPASARRDAYGAVMFLDMDNFKRLNDTLGHDVGDLLLKEVAARLLSCVRSEDTVARPAGDEFVIMLNRLDANEQVAGADALAIGEKIRAALSQPYLLLPDCAHVCSCSIGIALFKGTEDAVGELIKRADIAMYRAKSAGRNAVQLFVSEPGA